MKLDPVYLRQHYAQLSDEALLDVERADLVEMAQRIYDQEVGHRKLNVPPELVPEHPDSEKPEEYEGVGFDAQPGEEPEWLDDAAEVYSHAVSSAAAPSPEAVLTARDAMQAAGIPCHLDLSEIPPEKDLSPYGTHRWRVMVPGKLNLHATSVLEREIFNPEFEEGWRTHLETLSDAELRTMNPRVALCGLFDRIARVNRVYEEEMARRKLKSR